MRIGTLIMLLWGTLSVAVAATPHQLAMRLLLDNPRPYVGEEFILRLEFRYADLPAATPQLRWSGLEGFITTELPPLGTRREHYNGREQLVETTRKLLKPLSTKPVTLVASLRAGEATLSTSPLVIRPRQLPLLNRPEAFSGAVVKDARLEVAATGSGEREVVVTLSGQGSLSSMELTAQLQAGDELIPLSDRLFGQTGREQSRRLSYLYRPAASDRRPGFTTHCFDPVSAVYRTLQRAPSRSIWPRLLTLGVVLLLATMTILRLKVLCRPDLDRLIATQLGSHPRGMTQQDYRHRLVALRLSPELIAALLQRHAAGEERFAREPRITTSTASFSEFELIRKLRREMAMKIDK